MGLSNNSRASHAQNLLKLISSLTLPPNLLPCLHHLSNDSIHLDGQGRNLGMVFGPSLSVTLSCNSLPHCSWHPVNASQMSHHISPLPPPSAILTWIGAVGVVFSFSSFVNLPQVLCTTAREIFINRKPILPFPCLNPAVPLLNPKLKTNVYMEGHGLWWYGPAHFSRLLSLSPQNPHPSHQPTGPVLLTLQRGVTWPRNSPLNSPMCLDPDSIYSPQDNYQFFFNILNYRKHLLLEDRDSVLAISIYSSSHTWHLDKTWAPKSLQMVTAAMKLKDLLLGRKAMTNWDSVLRSRDITLLTKVRPVKAMVFPVVMYGCESWTIKKAEHQRIDALELWCWRRLLRVPWTARRSNQSILKEISSEYSLEGLMQKLKFQYFGHLMRRTDSLEKTLMLGKTEIRKEKGMTEDEMVGWHHWLNGHEFEQVLEVGEGQGSLVCCSPWGYKESDMPKRLNNSNNHRYGLDE